MLQAELRVVSGKQSGHVIPLVASRFLIGREEDCHLRPNSELVSRHHCVFKLDDYTLRVRDLGSTNGTMVNGERLRGEVELNTGDRVSVGKLEFEVAVGDSVAASVGATGSSTEADPTDSFQMGDTPSSAQTVEIPAVGENDASAEETAQEHPQFPEPQSSEHETAALLGDTMISPTTPPPMQQPDYGQPPVGYTMAYPQQQYPYAQPYGMPMMGYPQQPMPYPQMGMYPQQQMPMQPPQQPQVEPEPPAPDLNDDAQDVRLPNPADTGVKPPEDKSDGKNGQSQEALIKDTAAEIIKQYTQRRPQA